MIPQLTWHDLYSPYPSDFRPPSQALSTLRTRASSFISISTCPLSRWKIECSVLRASISGVNVFRAIRRGFQSFSNDRWRQESWGGECALGQGVQDRSAKFRLIWDALSVFATRVFVVIIWNVPRNFRDNRVNKFRIRNYFMSGKFSFSSKNFF